MSNVTDAEKQAYGQPNSRNLVLSFSNGTSLGLSNIVSETMNLEETLCDENELKFGKCSASVFRIQIDDITNSYKGLTIVPTITTNSISRVLGTYKVDSDQLTSNKKYRNLIAYDSIYAKGNLNVAEWYEALTFPMTLKAFRDSFFTNIGITQVTKTLVNDSMIVEKTMEATTLSALDVMQAICEINACFGHIVSDGKFDYYTLNPASTNNEDLVYDYKQGTLAYEDYKCKKITKVQIRQEENDIGVSVGTDGNTYIIQANFLVYGKEITDLTTIANNFLSKSVYSPYSIAKVTTKGRPYLQLGDYIKATASNGDIIEFPIMKRELNGIYGLMDTYNSSGTESFSEEVNSLGLDVKQMKGKSNVFERTLDHTVSKLNELSLDIEDNYSSTSETQTMIEQTATSISEEVSSKKIDEYTNYFPSTNLFPSEDLFPINGFTSTLEMQTHVEKTAEGITTKIDAVEDDLNQNHYTKTETASKIEETLDSKSYVTQSFLGDNYLSAVQTAENYYNKTQTSSKVEEILNTKSYVTETDLEGKGYTTETEAQNIATTTADSYSRKITKNMQVYDFGTNNVMAVDFGIPDTTKYPPQNYSEIDGKYLNQENGDLYYADFETLTSHYVWKFQETLLTIEQNICSYINQSADLIDIEANRIKIESDHFHLAEDGTLTCENAVFTNCSIKNGKIDIDTSEFTQDLIKLSYVQSELSEEAKMFTEIWAGGSQFEENSEDGLTRRCIISGGGITIQDTGLLNSVYISETGIFTDTGIIRGELQSVNGWSGTFWYQASNARTTVTVSNGIITNVTFT